MWRGIVLMVVCLVPAVLSECQPLTVVKDILDSKKMEGWWFRRYTHTDKPEPFPVKCLMSYWFLKPDSNFHIVETCHAKDGPRTSEGFSYYGQGIRNSTDGMIYFEAWDNGILTQFPVAIVDTDYTNYLIGHFCYVGLDFKVIYLRDHKKEVDERMAKSIDESLQQVKLSLSDMTPTLFTQCP